MRNFLFLFLFLIPSLLFSQVPLKKPAYIYWSNDTIYFSIDGKVSTTKVISGMIAGFDSVMFVTLTRLRDSIEVQNRRIDSLKSVVRDTNKLHLDTLLSHNDRINAAKQVPLDSMATARTELNLHKDTLIIHDTRISLAIQRYLDSLLNHRTFMNLDRDSLTSHNTRILVAIQRSLDSTLTARGELNWHKDTLLSHNDRINSEIQRVNDSLSVNKDSLQSHNVRINTEKQRMNDSLAVHSDSLESHNSRINAVLDSVQNKYTKSDTRTVIADSLAEVRDSLGVRYTKIDTRSVVHDSVSFARDSIATHRTALNAHTDSIGVHKDTLQSHNVRINAEVQRANDSLAVHRDSLNTHRVELNAEMDSVKNKYTKLDTRTVMHDSVSFARDSIAIHRTELNAQMDSLKNKYTESDTRIVIADSLAEMRDSIANRYTKAEVDEMGLGSGTVTSVATGNGLTGGTITTTGTLSIDTTIKATPALTGFLGFADFSSFALAATRAGLFVADSAGYLQWGDTTAAGGILSKTRGDNQYQPKDADLTTYAGISPSANAQTLLGQTFAQMRGSLVAPDSTLSRDTVYSNSVSKLNNGTGTTVAAGGGKTYKVSINTSQNIATLSNLTQNGWIKTSGNNGTLGVDSMVCLFIPIDSSYVSTIDTVGLFFTDKAITIDTLIVSAQGTAISVVVDYMFSPNSNLSGSVTKIITSPSASTSVTTGTVVSSFNNASITARNFIKARFPTVTTKQFKELDIIIKYH